MVIAYTIFIYMGSQKKMPPGDESEEGKAEAGSLPNKNKNGWKIYTSRAQSLLK